MSFKHQEKENQVDCSELNTFTSKIKLRDRLDSLSKDFLVGVENPLDKLVFKEERNVIKKLPYSFWFFLLAIGLMSGSILFNSYLLKKCDPVLYKTASTLKGFVVDQISKPYVVTIGEYGNIGIAKEDALRLLPSLKQIDIKGLNSGIYTFEMERFSSKKKAYSLAKKYIDEGYDAVHVRYLPATLAMH